MSLPDFSRRRAAARAAILACAAVAALAGPRAVWSQESPPSGRGEIFVFAAASLADVLTEIGKGWEAASGSRPVFNFGASSDLARQLLTGAPADVFFSADEANPTKLLACCAETAWAVSRPTKTGPARVTQDTAASAQPRALFSSSSGAETPATPSFAASAWTRRGSSDGLERKRWSATVPVGEGDDSAT